jgi:hypothetical protein
MIGGGSWSFLSVEGVAVEDLEACCPAIDTHMSVFDGCGSRTISSISSSKPGSCGTSIGGINCCSITGDMSIAAVGKLIGGNVTVPGLALSSDPGSKRSINLGDCPEKLGLVVGISGTVFISSNRLLKLLVTESGSNRGRGSSRM